MKTSCAARMQESVINVSTPIWGVKEAEAQKDFTLLLTFVNGEKRLYNAQPLLDKSIYEPLKNPYFFMRAHIAGDSVAWNDEIDIASEHLYECSVLIEKVADILAFESYCNSEYKR